MLQLLECVLWSVTLHLKVDPHWLLCIVIILKLFINFALNNIVFLNLISAADERWTSYPSFQSVQGEFFSFTPSIHLHLFLPVVMIIQMCSSYMGIRFSSETAYVRLHICNAGGRHLWTSRLRQSLPDNFFFCQVEPIKCSPVSWTDITTFHRLLSQSLFICHRI